MFSKRKESGKGKKQTRFTGWLSKENREALMVDVVLTLAFLALAILIVALSVVFVRSQQLQQQNEIERQFNNIALALQQNMDIAAEGIIDDNVTGIGVYNSSGSLIMSWGNAYNFLPVSSIAEETAASGSDTIMNYDSDTNTMEYIRFLRQPLPITNLTVSRLFGSLQITDNSSIIFISFDGSAYASRLRLVYFISLLAFVAVIFLYVFVMKIDRQNRQYKEQMVKQSNLVNLGQAARTLTHEIKNPLSAITIQLALLKRQLRDSEYLDELQLIEGETQRLISLTNRVSDFLRNPEGQPEQIDMAALINQLIPLFPYPIRVLETSAKQAYILFDPDRLRSVLENILKNAVESCEGRDPNVEVEIILGRMGMYHVYIRDRGDGIQGDVEKLFDPFYTTKIHGSGIGLSISRQFLRARGGDIKLSARPGGGTVVEVVVAKYSFVQELVVSTASAKKKTRQKKLK